MNDGFIPDLLSISKFKLDDECAEQAHLYHSIGDKLRKATDNLKIIKLEYDIWEAELKLRIKRDPAVYKISGNRGGQPTIDSVQCVIVKSSKYREWKEKIIHLEGEVEALKVDLRTAEHRREELGNLVILDGRDYFAKPKMPQETRQRAEEKSQKRIARLGSYRNIQSEEENVT